ncbi:hypothetical protein GCM10018775_02580 [Streptomyces umbrinus]|nr:hypothetical protein GCM10018775_02580 [Streptomyces umbrinus]
MFGEHVRVQVEDLRVVACVVLMLMLVNMARCVRGGVVHAAKLGGPIACDLVASGMRKTMTG